MQPLSRASTPIADRIEENLSALDWQACQKCAREYRPFNLKDGVCFDCIGEAAFVRDRLQQILRPMLVTLAEKQFETTDANSRAYIAARDFNPALDNLYLFGPPGHGKTHLACKIVRRAIQKRLSVLFLRPTEWLRSVRGLVGVEEQTAINRACGHSVLVIDDLGVEKSTDFAITALFDLIEQRIMDGRNGLVVTSNLSLDALSAKLGDDRLTSRLSGLCRVIELADRDRRQD